MSAFDKGANLVELKTDLPANNVAVKTKLPLNVICLPWIGQKNNVVVVKTESHAYTVAMKANFIYL